mmetsp:Transcript_74272/g.117103  ORF Transcript_74272/g.117103 Transcript_74272/m.117103 type:complete len:99 (+) Transcript_74272:84-380(+)
MCTINLTLGIAVFNVFRIPLRGAYFETPTPQFQISSLAHAEHAWLKAAKFASGMALTHVRRARRGSCSPRGNVTAHGSGFGMLCSAYLLVSLFSSLLG